MYLYLIVSCIALLQCSCFLNASIHSLNNENTDSPEVGSKNPFVEVPEPKNLKSSYTVSNSSALNWESSSQEINNYKIVISLAGPPDEYCTSSEAMTTNNPSILFENLNSDTTYYYRICSVINSSSSKGMSGTFKTLKFIQRAAAYNNFSNWNDYLQNDGSKYFNASQTTCPGNTPSSDGYSSCINGGLVQKLTMPFGILCNRISAYDKLGVFRWNCDDSSGTAIIYSSDLKPFKGLQDLISNNQFLDSLVIIKVDNVEAYSSVAEKWWTNPIEELPDSPAGSSIALSNGGSTSGKIFMVTTAKSGGGYTIGENKISVVTKRGVELKKDTNNSINLIKSNSGVKYLWLEGKYSGNNTTADLFSIVSNSHNRFHNLELKEVSATALNLGSSINSIISDFHIHHCSQGILGSTSGWGILTTNGRFSNCIGVAISYLYYSRISNITFSSNSNTINEGLVYRAHSSIITNLTFANNTTNYSFRLANTNNNLIHNVLSLNSNNSYFLYAFSASTHTFSQLMSFGSSSSELVISNTSGDHKFTNNLVLENTTECNIANNTAYSPGLTVGTCLNHGLYSNSTLITTSPDYTKFFVGKVTSDDSVNPNDALGTALFSNITEWTNFSNPFRLWGADGGTFPASDNKGICSSGSCRIWDYRLIADANNLAFNSTNNVTTKNEAFIANTNCPSAVHGNKVTTYVDYIGTNYTFLTNAMEIIGDGIGNDNTLCESNEKCIYTPNFGSYQGEGDYMAQGTCTFQNGTISNVKMYAYPENGL